MNIIQVEEILEHIAKSGFATATIDPIFVNRKKTSVKNIDDEIQVILNGSIRHCTSVETLCQGIIVLHITGGKQVMYTKPENISLIRI